MDEIPDYVKKSAADWSHSFLRQQRQQNHNFFRFVIKGQRMM